MASGPLHPGTDVDAVVSAAPFADPVHARAGLRRLAETVPGRVMSALAALLVDSPDPDRALTLFERLVESPHGAETLRQFELRPFLIQHVITVFSYSKWLGETLMVNPDLLHGFVRERQLDRMLSIDELRESFARFRSRSYETDLPVLMARFKRREYVRILLRDVLGLATLAETTAEISALTDVLIEEALASCDSALRSRYGSPQYIDAQGRNVPAQFSVVSLGKLGGNELNYSSDIDLLFLYSDGPDAGTTTVTSHEFFTRLAQELTDVLSRVTIDGPVFRIDLRLRPRGHEGEPSVSLVNALGYYSRIAQDWELQALIKARHSAGSIDLTRAFIKGVQPFVYRPEINFAAIKTALVSLQKIHKKTLPGVVGRHTLRTIDVKIDRGGIRDIEFLVQCLQRVYGGSEAWLRSGGTLFSLAKLNDKGHLTGKDCNALAQTYTLLRKLEHLLQLRHGQRTHKLPAGQRELAILYRALTGEKGAVDAGALVELVRNQMSAVSAIYNRVVLQQQTAEAKSAQTPQSGILMLSTGGVAKPGSRLRTDCPELYRLAESASLGTTARKNLHRFLAAASTSGERYRILLKHAGAVERAMPVFEHSTFLTDILARHPEEIVEIPAARVEEPRPARDLRELPAGKEASLDAVRKALRAEFRHRVMNTASQSILFGRSIWPTMLEHSETAYSLIRAAWAASAHSEGLSVWAVGRLGSSEFEVLSDADLVFVRDEYADPIATTRAAEELMETLSAYTREGTIMSVDTRLRPHGKSGDLVTTPPQLQAYFAKDAQSWEALTYLKARCVAGTEDASKAGAAAISDLMKRFRQAVDFRAELRWMRTRLEKSEPAPNLKLGPGGAYDIDFITGFLLIQAGESDGAVSQLDRVARLERLGALSRDQASTLRGAAELFRALEHAVRLVEGRARKWFPANPSALRSVETIVAGVLGREIEGSLAEELQSRMVAVRAIFDVTFKD